MGFPDAAFSPVAPVIMNSYSLYLDKCPPDNTNAAANTACRKLARQLGLLFIFSEFKMVKGNDGTADGITVPSKNIICVTGLRLPDSLEPGPLGAVVNDAGNLIVGVIRRDMADSQMTDQMNNFDKTSVAAGDFVCAIVPHGVDISNELNAQVEIVFGLTNATSGSIVMGIANDTQREGAYETPFAEACAYANFGPPSQWSVVAMPMAPAPGVVHGPGAAPGYVPPVVGGYTRG